MSSAFENIDQEIYQTLHRLASGLIAAENGVVTLQATGLVHEAYARLAKSDPRIGDEAHFCSLAARSMRRILIDHARARKRRRHLVENASIMLTVDAESRSPDWDVLALHDTLTRLAASHPDKAEIVELKYFGGLSFAAIARLRGVSPRTIERGWEFARTWIYRHMEGGSTPAQS